MNTIIVDGMAFAMPLFIIAVGGIYSERSGVTNLALEGFLGAGGSSFFFTSSMSTAKKIHPAATIAAPRTLLVKMPTMTAEAAQRTERIQKTYCRMRMRSSEAGIRSSLL